MKTSSPKSSSSDMRMCHFLVYRMPKQFETSANHIDVCHLYFGLFSFRKLTSSHMEMDLGSYLSLLWSWDCFSIALVLRFATAKWWLDVSDEDC
jgi:hypothetical protein